jgi:hypothetical protein
MNTQPFARIYATTVKLPRSTVGQLNDAACLYAQRCIDEREAKLLPRSPLSAVSF